MGWNEIGAQAKKKTREKKAYERDGRLHTPECSNVQRNRRVSLYVCGTTFFGGALSLLSRHDRRMEADCVYVFVPSPSGRDLSSIPCDASVDRERGADFVMPVQRERERERERSASEKEYQSSQMLRSPLLLIETCLSRQDLTLFPPILSCTASSRASSPLHAELGI